MFTGASSPGHPGSSRRPGSAHRRPQPHTFDGIVTPRTPTGLAYTHPDIEVDAVVAVLVKGGFEPTGDATVHRTVLDTFDGRLNAAGLRLEVRESVDRHLVLTGGGPAAAHVAVSEPPRFSLDLPGGPLRARLAPVLGVRALLPVATVTVRERVVVQRDKWGKTVGSVVVHDRVAGWHGPPWLVEVEELTGYAKPAEETRTLLESLGLQQSGVDLMALAAAAAGTDLRGHTASPTVGLDRTEPSFDAFRRVLANLADEVDANWEGTVGAVDPEFLHDLRVGVRRTRSVLAQSKRVLPVEVRDRFREGFGWLGGATGAARDLDVYVMEWDSYIAPLGAQVAGALGPLAHHLAVRRQSEHATLTTLLTSGRYHDLMVAWRAWLDAPADRQDLGIDAPTPIGLVAAHRIAAANERLVSRGRGIGPGTPAEELHELRKDAKKLRYLLECFGAVLPPGEGKAFVRRLKALQENLGEHQDTEVHTTQLRAMSHDLHQTGDAGAETLVAMGQLAGEFERRRMVARAAFAERFAAYDTPRTRRTLGVLLAAAANG